MNLNGLIRMIVNMVLRRGIGAMTKPAAGTKRRGAAAPGQAPDPAATARETAKRARQAARITRKLGR
ncbi:MAG TPA: hypothetical protein PKD10_06260 [Paracoccaceae bacterium]|nr:hypothetical protein [Paracoccaceae bacterium]HMO73165.1 hypothetical protein [Paracoccaceae bacterium]